MGWVIVIINKLEDECQNLKQFKTYEECNNFILNNYKCYKKDHISDYTYRNVNNKYLAMYIIPIHEI